jgi:hypothetical protein
MTFPYLQATSGLGSYGRNNMAILISGPRTRNGSQGRIYSWFKQQGLGQQYIQFLINTSGVKYLPKVNPWTGM